MGGQGRSWEQYGQKHRGVTCVGDQQAALGWEMTSLGQSAAENGEAEAWRAKPPSSQIGAACDEGCTMHAVESQAGKPSSVILETSNY